MQDFKIYVWFGCYTPDSILIEKKYECRNNNDVINAQDDFKIFFTEIVNKDNPELLNVHKYVEKIYIIDYEAYLNNKLLGLKIGDRPSELYEIFSAMEELDHLTDERVQLYIELADDFNHMDAVKKVQNSLDILIKDLNSKEYEVGHYFVHKLFSIKMPDHLYSYFDYTAYGKDLITSNYTIQVGSYVFFID